MLSHLDIELLCEAAAQQIPTCVMRIFERSEGLIDKIFCWLNFGRAQMGTKQRSMGIAGRHCGLVGRMRFWDLKCFNQAPLS